MERFRVALTRDFLLPDGSPAYPMVDLSSLTSDPRIEIGFVPVDRKVPRAAPVPAADLSDYDALVLMDYGFARTSVPPGDRLSLLCRFGVGFDDIDVAACSEHGVALVNAPDGVRRPVALAAIAFMLALTYRMPEKDKLAREGVPGWAKVAHCMGTGLVGRTLGLLGVGNIGAEVFRLAQPFGMSFVAHDPFVDADLARSLGVRLVGIEELFATADVLSVHCPLNDRTRGLVGARLLGLMKPTAFFINTARGAIVDEKELAKTLQARRIAGAAIDVFSREPCPADEPLLRLDNVIVAPHAICFTDQCFAELGASNLRAVLAVMEGREPANIVNRDILQNAAWRARVDRYRHAFGPPRAAAGS